MTNGDGDRDRHSSGDGDGPTDETEKERLERNFTDLLQELRVAQTGVQILFAFLLTLPFAARFGEIAGFEKIIYIVTLVAAAGAAAMIISPVAYHRALFRRGRKAELVKTAHRMASGGLALMVVAMVGAVVLAVSVAVGPKTALIIGVITAIFFGLLWGVLPWRSRREAETDLDEAKRRRS